MVNAECDVNFARKLDILDNPVTMVINFEIDIDNTTAGIHQFMIYNRG